MFLAILVLLVALSLSGIAAYYSIIGLAAIFAAAVIPIIIMGGILEVAKLTVTVWLHQHWDRARWVMKLYLVPAVAVLMFITSMGIFGFLSKSHIEQTSANAESLVQVERIVSEISRAEAGIARSEQKIAKAEASTGNNNASIQQQIDTEQQRIDQAYERIKPAIAEQNAIIENARKSDTTKVEPYLEQLKGLDAELARLDTNAKEYETALSNVGKDTSAIDAQVAPYQQQIDQINSELDTLQRLSKSGSTAEIKKFQQTIGIKSDGIFGSDTAKRTNEWKANNQKRIDQLSRTVTQLRKDHEDNLDKERDRLRGLIAAARGADLQAIKDRKLDVLKRIDEVRNQESPAVKSAIDQIAKIRAGADAQVAQSQKLINGLRNSLTVGVDSEVETIIAEETAKIKSANAALDQLVEQKFALEAKTRQLEAEVGPIKYIAELIYGTNADQSLLEEAVRWVIILIVAVFDPLAIMMLLAATESFAWRRQDKENLIVQETDNKVPSPIAFQENETATESNTAESDSGRADENTEEIGNTDKQVGTEVRGDTEDSQKVVTVHVEHIVVPEPEEETPPQSIIKVPDEPLFPEHGTPEAKAFSDNIIAAAMAKQFGSKDEEKDKFENENVESVGVTQTEESPAPEAKVDTQTFADQEIEKEVQESIILEFMQPAQEPNNASTDSEIITTDQEETADLGEPGQPEATVKEETIEDSELFAWKEEDEGDPEKRAKRIWKRLNPDSTLKEQEQLLDNKLINELPWQQYVKASDDELDQYTRADFGTQFPTHPIKGDTFVRVDYLPSRLYKWNGTKWIEIDKDNTDAFTYNEEYIQHLIEKLGSGEYDPDLLNDAERAQIEQQLKSQDL